MLSHVRGFSKCLHYYLKTQSALHFFHFCTIFVVVQWCYNKECVEIGERPKALNGEWGAWGSWSECSRTCGGGVSMRERLCNNPQPANKGRYCLGKRYEYNICNIKVHIINSLCITSSNGFQDKKQEA